MEKHKAQTIGDQRECGRLRTGPAENQAGVVCLSRRQPWRMTPEHQAVLLTHEAKTHENWMHVWGEGGGSSSRVDGVYADITELTISCQ